MGPFPHCLRKVLHLSFTSEQDGPLVPDLDAAPETPSIQNSKWLASISLGVVVCFCVSLGVVPDFNDLF